MARAVGGKKFDKLMVSRVYFGNWLRDYSQAIDTGIVKSVSAEAVRLLLCVLGFMTFGFGSGEFEVTADRLGCYRPEDHIDNPKNYADNQDARQYDRRLRGPIDEEVELAVDESTGMKNYIANERDGSSRRRPFMTSAQHVRNLFGKCIELGRSYQRNNRKADFYEALRLLGTGLHCLEDFLAHSNYLELALIEMGERDVFPHVGSRTQMTIPAGRDESRVWPLVTGTFGGVDFLHSVTGEVSDKLTQNEIQELEGALQQNSHNDTSYIAELLDKIPDGIFGGDDKKEKMNNIQQNAQSAQMENTSISPRDPEEFTQYAGQIFEQIMPAIEFHDELMKSISEAIEKIPILPKIIEQLEDQMSMWVFTIIAPFVLPIISQVKNELNTGSQEIIASSEAEQLIVWNDDNSTDPTHSMLSKDHFSNILNEPAGKTASQVLKWVVPQLMEAWDDDGVDVDRLLTRIINGVLHHPAQRDGGEDGAQEGREIMFRSVESWWNEMDEGAKDEYRQKLSSEGVRRGENHKEGVHDSGHGCGKPLGMHKNFGGSGGGSMEDRIAGAAAGAIFEGVTGGISDFVEQSSGGQVKLPDSEGRGESFSGGGLLSQIGNSLLGGGFKKDETEFENRRDNDDGSYTESRTEYGRSGNRYEQAEYSETRRHDGSERTEYQRYEQDNNGRGQGYEERTETRPSYGGGYEERTERRYESNEDSYQESSGWQRQQRGDDDGERRHHGGHHGRDEDRDDGYGRQDDNYGRRDDGYGRQDDNYGRREEGFGRQDDNYGRREEGFGRQDDFGRRDDGYGRQEERQEYGRNDGFGGREGREDFGRGDEYGSREEYGRDERRERRRSGDGGGGWFS
ncbi:heterokaryon incompatibility protein Het-C-domain-containing protein [Xylariaceae sp. FL1272]|nr:heterokaryon incompatibility protein Het-C-domain-containing protein [Xylariaceae sp. FL1272]